MAETNDNNTKSPAVLAEGLHKNFRLYQKEAGLKGSVKSFFVRNYEINPAVQSIHLEIQQGEFVGLLGPNGAGKTTLMKMFCGIMAPSSGHLRILGEEPFRRSLAFRRQIALVMGQKSQLWWDIPAMDSFLLLQRYYDIEEAPFRKKLFYLADLLNVRHVLQVHVRKLSLGERMKLELIASLLHEPKILFLDEPTIGLDLVSQRSMREFLATYQKQEGITVVLTSHYMKDVEELCSRLVVVQGGQIYFDGMKSAFLDLLGSDKMISLEFARPLPPHQEQMLQTYEPEWNANRTQVVFTAPSHHIAAILKKLCGELPVVAVQTQKISMERVLESLMVGQQNLPKRQQQD